MEASELLAYLDGERQMCWERAQQAAKHGSAQYAPGHDYWIGRMDGVIAVQNKLTSYRGSRPATDGEWLAWAETLHPAEREQIKSSIAYAREHGDDPNL